MRDQQRKAARPAVTPAPKNKKVPEGHNPHAPRGVRPWAPLPDTWRGRRFHIVGGGPSLKDKATLARMGHTFDAFPDDCWIAVNNSYKIAPWSDILHFADAEWWKWNGADVLKVWPKDRIISTATSDIGIVKLTLPIKRWWRDRNKFAETPDRLHGWDSGTQAINMAYHLGAREIVLWGIDMQPGPKGECQWHNEHKRPTLAENYQKKFAPSLAETVRQLYKREVPVVRATEPGIPEAPFKPPEIPWIEW